MLRRVDPMKPHGALYGAVVRMSASRFGLWLSRHVAWKLDPYLLTLTRGRIGFAMLLPTAVLETTGARSGEARRNAVIYFHDGDRVTIIPSKAGAPEHPAWFHNACAHPDVRFGGEPFRAEVVAGDAERDRLWALADRVFPPFADYRVRAAVTGRTIPILQLTPR